MGTTPIDLEKMRSIGYLARGQTRSNAVKESRRRDGVRVKETVDEFGNSTFEHATKDDRVDVMLRPKTQVLEARVK
jgi:hypothetical protein